MRDARSPDWVETLNGQVRGRTAGIRGETIKEAAGRRKTKGRRVEEGKGPKRIGRNRKEDICACIVTSDFWR
ncbi:MAG: hypothetical protein U5K51_14335 [Flavobacteriaceae bacterium]|nr:hypothetical protein [Flavobacteriaceae bacterium]